MLSKAATARTSIDASQMEGMSTASMGLLVKKIDFSRFVRLLRGQNTIMAKKNVKALSDYLAAFVGGGGAGQEVEALGGKTVRIYLRIGTLIARQNKIHFEALPLTQIVSDSRDQKDDMASKMSAISRLSGAFKP